MEVDTPKGKFYRAINEFSANRKRHVMKLPEFYACDPVAMALALEDSILLEADRKFCDVELWGELTRGQMVIDWTNKMGKEANVDIVTKIDHVRVKELMEDMLKE